MFYFKFYLAIILGTYYKGGLVMDELHLDKRTINVNFRVTAKEKAEIEAYCKKNKIEASRFIRHSVFKSLGKK